MEKDKENQVNQEELDAMYLSQIDELKKKMDNEMISKEEYDRLKAQHKTLLDDFVNRRPAPKVEEKPKKSALELAKKLKKVESGNMSNRDYVALALEYREAFIKERGQDPFANSALTDKGTVFEKFGENEEAIEIAEGLKYTLENNEDPVAFNIRLGSILQDDQGIINAVRKNRK